MKTLATISLLLALAASATAHAEPLQVFYATKDGRAGGVQTVSVEESTIEVVPLTPAADPRAACVAFCVWFETPAGAPGVSMVLFNKRDGTSRDRTVAFVRGAGDLGAIKANINKIVLISRSVFGEAHFEPGAVAIDIPSVATPAGGPPPEEKGPPAWRVAIATGATFLGTEGTVNTASLATRFHFADRFFADLSFSYLIPSSFTLATTRFSTGGMLVRAGVGIVALETDRVVLRVLAGPQATWYEIYRVDENGQWATHWYGWAGAAVDVRVYGPAWFTLRSDVALSGADVIVSVEGADGERRLNNPLFDLLAGVAVSF